MQPEQCRELLQKKLSEKILKYLSEHQLDNLGVYIFNKGISDAAIENVLIPALTKEAISKRKTKILDSLIRNIDHLIQFHHLYDPIPKKEEKNDSKEQRNLDRISRLLSVATRLTPCIAVAIQDKFFITANAVKDEKTSQKVVQGMIEKKWALLRKFLFDVKKGFAETNPLIDLNHDLQFSISSKTEFSIYQIALSLQAEELGGTAVLNSKQYNVTERLTVDLIKLAEFYLEGLITQGKKGFSEAQCQALESEIPNIYFPTPELEKEGSLHAEQLLLLILNQESKYKSKPSSPIKIGISKLCCSACAAVLDQYSDTVTYRGKSGKSYPNTIDITTQAVALYKPTQTLPDCLVADDSGSEVEIEYDSSQKQAIQIKFASGEFYFSRLTKNKHYIPNSLTKLQ